MLDRSNYSQLAVRFLAYAFAASKRGRFLTAKKAREVGDDSTASEAYAFACDPSRTADDESTEAALAALDTYGDHGTITPQSDFDRKVYQEAFTASTEAAAYSRTTLFKCRGILAFVSLYYWRKVSSAAATKVQASDPADLLPVVELFDNAQESIKFPKIEITVNGVAFRLTRAGVRAKEPGSVNVLSTEYERDDYTGETKRDWFGRISRDGTAFLKGGAPAGLREALSAFADDPSGLAATHGKELGSCCFCRRELTDERSLLQGYGPTCAKNFGLAWGTRPATELAAFES